ncbi:TlpA family protein disulfide reductase [Zoogloea sp.]|uniref:TlpA family protein disulfide reductase n=1 Tax=Zoogloea sp. TaxID=49181 RepID=UPI0035B25EB9
MNRTLSIALVIVVALAAAAAGIYSARQSAPAATPAASAEQQAALDKLLALELPDSGSAKQPLANWKGKVLVVNFWATWCPPCRKEIPAFSAMSTKYRDKGVQFVGISIDTADNVRNFQAANAVSYPLVIASPSVVGLTEALGNTSQALPFTVIVTREGRIGLVKLGTLSEDELDRKLAELSRS